MTPDITETIHHIIAERKRRGIAPYVCTLRELRHALPGTPDDKLLNAMRELHYNGTYRASLNINRIPMLIDNDTTIQ